MAGTLKIAFLNVWFYTVFLLASAVVIPALILLVALWQPFHSYRSTMRRVRKAIAFYGRVITRIPYPLVRLRFEDRSQDGPAGPCIFIANHRSASDAFLMCVLREEGVQIVNTWPFRIPVLGFFAKVAGYLNVRTMPAEEFFEKAGKLLRDGVSLIFFPEGTRSGGKEMGNFHGAAFRLALQERAAIVPLCLSGNEEIPRKGTLFLRPGVIRVRRLPALPWDEFKDLTPFALKNRVRETIQRELAAMEGAA